MVANIREDLVESKKTFLTSADSKLGYLENILYRGNCVELLSDLPPSLADLIYVDPPFFSNRSYFANAGKATQRRVFTDRWLGGLEEYSDWIESLLTQCRRILKNSGSIYVHCDHHASHYVKQLLDELFGYSNFRNEIVWRRQNAHNDWSQGARHFGRIHDVILVYTASERYTWNPIFTSYEPEYLDRVYRFTEVGSGRRYALGDLSGPGGASKNNPRYSLLGVTRNWRYSEAKMKRLLAEGRIVQSEREGVPRVKRYLDEMKGRQVQDIWDDINPVTRGREKVGYPTQKPIKLLERIIAASSNVGDLVIDPLFGSGTSLLAATRLERRWIGMDSSHYACSLARNRLRGAGVKAEIRDGVARFSRGAESCVPTGVTQA